MKISNIKQYVQDNQDLYDFLYDSIREDCDQDIFKDNNDIEWSFVHSDRDYSVYYAVVSAKLPDGSYQYFKTDGWYDSWAGTEFGEISELYEVERAVKQIDYWKKV